MPLKREASGSFYKVIPTPLVARTKEVDREARDLRSEEGISPSDTLYSSFYRT